MRSPTHDAGDLGCGNGLAGWFRRQLVEASPGEELRVLVRDPAAPAELPALTRLLGHTVISIDSLEDSTMIRIRKETR